METTGAEERMTRERLLARLRDERARWAALLGRIPEARMTEPGVAGQWSIKDIVAHIGYYERSVAARAREVARGERFVPQEIDRVDVEERNARVYEANRDRPLAEVLADERRAFEEVLAAVEALSDEQLTTPIPDTAWIPPDRAPWTAIVADSVGHYEEHRPDIEAWLAGRGAGG